MPLTAYEDSRVDVCLYFVAPHNLRPLDVAVMRRIGALTPVVPIIAKVPVLASMTHAPSCQQNPHPASSQTLKTQANLGKFASLQVLTRTAWHYRALMISCIPGIDLG